MSNIHRTNLNIAQKIQIISALEEKSSTVKQLQAEYNCGKTQIYDLIKNKDSLKATWLQSGTSDMRKRFHQSTQNVKLNELVYDWYVSMCSSNTPVSGPMMKECAAKFAQGLGLDQFKASNGWLCSFRQRHNIKHIKASVGEANDASPKVVKNWSKKLCEIIKGFKLADIANADETALFFRAIPNKMVPINDDSANGEAEERLTVLVCAFADGKFEPPLVIGKSKNPNCFNGIKHNELPIVWRANKQAWMTADIMEDWLRALNAKMEKENRNILLFLDNAKSHSHLKLTNIKLAFVPPTTTSILQPINQGVIKCIKVHYRKQLLQFILPCMGYVQNFIELSSKISVMDAVQWLHIAFTNVPATYVKNCFRKAGFPFERKDDEKIIDPTGECGDVLALLNEVNLDVVSWTDYIKIDSNVATEADTIEDFLQNFTVNHSIVDFVNESDQVEDPVCQPQPVSTAEAIACLERLKAYALTTSNANMLQDMYALVESVNCDMLTKKKSQTQYNYC